jgi:hypothetical protein
MISHSEIHQFSIITIVRSIDCNDISSEVRARNLLEGLQRQVSLLNAPVLHHPKKNKQPNYMLHEHVSGMNIPALYGSHAMRCDLSLAAVDGVV